MQHIPAFLLLDSLETILEWFTGDTSISNWETTTTDWLIAALVIAAVCTGAMAVAKFVMKATAPNPRRRIWPRKKAVVFILSGLFPVMISVSTAWYASHDFMNIIAVPGLFKGVFLSWTMYLLLMLLSHAWGEWREDLF
jgi:hypothetical protein